MDARTSAQNPVTSTGGQRYRRIQALRFFAAAGVVFFHASYYLQASRPDATAFVRFFDYRFSWGVQLFFVISGFVIAHSIERMTVREFARRRFLRIYPAFWIAVGLVVGARFALSGKAPDPSDLWRALTLLPFGPVVYPLAVEWSLVYEVFFYAVIGAVALAGWTRARDALCVAWLAAIAISAVVAPKWGTQFLPFPQQIAFSAFNAPFIVGMLVHRVHARTPDSWRVAMLCCSVVLAASSDLWSRGEARLFTLALGFGALALWAVLADRRRALPAGHPLVALGDWSYGVYLLHVPIVTFLLSRGAGVGLSPDLLLIAIAAAALLGGSVFGIAESALHRWLVRATAPGALPPVTA